MRSIIKDRTGNIWMGGNDGLWRYDGQNWISISPNFTGYIYEDSKENIWTSAAGTDMENWVLYRYNKQPLAYEIPTATSILSKRNMFFGILEDKEGGIWLGTLNGVGRFDGVAFDWFTPSSK